jgi:cell division protein FtsL
MTTTAHATQPVSRPSSGERRRPALRVVDTRKDGTRRSVAGIAGTVLASVLFASVFSVVTCQVLLIQAQSRLDDLDARIDAQVTEDKHLRHEIATLQSPERIVNEATDRLGMVTTADADIGYLQPQPSDEERAALGETGGGRAVAGTTGSSGRAVSAAPGAAGGR